MGVNTHCANCGRGYEMQKPGHGLSRMLCQKCYQTDKRLRNKLVKRSSRNRRSLARRWQDLL